ncbi:MAG: class I SAM-dependent methyltransferase [Deltaproteobacteria bacterium]|nr:class I SAM-dependent methyltransferase [Deltaproteobacteria bacterium]
MKGASQLLVDTGLLEGARSPLLIGPPPEDASTLAETGAELFFFEEASHARAGVGHAGVAPRTGDHDLAVVFHPKGKRRRDYALAVASHALTEGGRLAIVGEKREGIGSAKKALKVTAKHSGSHAKLFVGEPRTDLPAQLSEWERRWDTGLGFEAVSYPGTFAEGRLDDASGLLLETAALPETGSLLDLGCGSGVLGLAAKSRVPALAVTLADSDHLAVAATKRGAELAELEVHALASDAVAKVDGTFDAILLNPPFHEGVATSADVAESVLRGASERLATGGVLWVVANRFLTHETVLEGAGLQVDRAAENGRFKVLRCQR